MIRNRPSVPQGLVPSDSSLHDLREQCAHPSILQAAAGDLEIPGFCLILADNRMDRAILPPALASEREEANAFPDGGVGMILRRQIARSIASLATGKAPESLLITRSPAGAPHFARADTGLHISFSARGPFGLIGLSRGRIGVDIEMPVSEHNIPWNMLSDNERMTLRANNASRAEAFQRLWAAKEAVAKCLGTGFALPPEMITIEGWQANGSNGTACVADARNGASKEFLHNIFQIDLIFMKATLEQPPTGGLVVVAAHGAPL